LTSCTCSDNCPSKTSEFIFDGTLSGIYVPDGATLNDVLELLNEFTLDTVNSLNVEYVITGSNCLGLTPGTYGYSQIFDTLNSLEAEVNEFSALFADNMPIGSMIVYPVAAAPNSKWLACEGQSLSTATYPALFAKIGYNFGGSGASFNLPDLRRQFIAGYDAVVTDYNVIGQGAGLNSVTLTANQSGLRSHNHTATFTGNALGAHSHAIWADPNDGAGSGAIDLTNDDGSSYYNNANNGAFSGSGLYIEPVSAGTPSGSVSVANASSSPAIESHENRPPFLAFPWMIKVLN
jgi:microcystin-dependent protein